MLGDSVAKHNKTHNQNKHLDSDDAPDISSAPKLLSKLLKQNKPLAQPVTFKLTLPKTKLHLYEDRRTFHPAKKQRPPESITKPARKLIVPKTLVRRGPNGKPLQSHSLPHTVAFKGPKHVLLCIRRKIRKEVLHALKLTRAGAGAKKRKRNEYSDIRC